MEYKAIETHYNGYRFRSRLEARWAVFFDAAGIKYEYEPEGFELDDGTKYLPDFYIPHFKGRGRGINGEDGIYVEIKGNLTEADLHKIMLFSGFEQRQPTDTRIIIFGQIPDVKWIPGGYWTGSNEWYEGFYSFDYNKDEDEYFYNLLFSEGDYYWAQPKVGKNGGLVLDYPDNPYDYVDNKRTAEAYMKARQARFEYGENG